MNKLFNIASLLAAAVMLISCGEKMGGGSGSGSTSGIQTASLQLVVDKDVIQSNGTDVATFQVLYDGLDVTSEATLYDEDRNLISQKTFTATESGDYKFFARYGTSSTYNKDLDDKGLLTVKAISVPVPAVATDPAPNKTSFVHRAFLTQYTGTGCGNCPGMINILRKLIEDKTIPNKAVLAAVHSYDTGDPAYIDSPSVNSYPYLTVDESKAFTVASGAPLLYNLVNESTSSAAKAGISVNPQYYPETRDLVVRVSVKAAVDGIFNVGLWLLEDGIYGDQAGAPNDSYDTHNNCVRIADSQYYTTYFGYPLGELKAGETAEKTFVMYVKKKFVVENLHLAAFVSYGTKKGKTTYYSVCNAIDCPIDEPTPYEYK